MSIPIKWNNEISRFLKVYIKVDENIKLHQYFTVYLYIKNISMVKMDLDLEISDSSTELIGTGSKAETDYFDYKNRRYSKKHNIIVVSK